MLSGIYSQAYVDGYNAYLEDKGLIDNPFDESTSPVQYNNWIDGYITGQDEHENDLPMPPRSAWINGKPTGVGYYWVNKDDPRIVRIIIINNALLVVRVGDDSPCSLRYAEWITSYQSVVSPRE